MRLLLILLLTLNLLNAQKIALLIGNSDYSFSPLKNPTHDVDGIAQTLREIGFKRSDIKILKNASKTQMESALANFSQKAQSAEIALIYFSGHGMQVNNTNYLFPARTTATKPIHLRTLVDLNYFIESATSAKYGIILIDACRDNPLVKYFNNGKKGSVHKGLGQVEPTVGQMVIGFATSAGDTADDGNGNMSPYAKALKERLKTPNKDISKVLGLVALDVSKEYNQNPIYRANLAYDVCLSGSCREQEVKVVETIVYRDRVVEPTSSPVRRVVNHATKGITTIDGLMYQNQALTKQDDRNYFADKSSGRVQTWQGAIDYCSNLSLGGYADWRLPKKFELRKLLTKTTHKTASGHDRYMRKAFAKNLQEGSVFWTSEERDSSSAWFVNFHDGDDFWSNKSSNNCALCVR